MKRIFFFLISISLLFIVGCENTIALPNLDGKSREEIEEIMKEYDIDYEFKFADSIITSDIELDKFVRYSDGYKSGSNFPLGKFLIVYTTVLPLNPYLHKELEMNFEWEGKSFINDGTGEVELVYATDGDTATFKDKVTGESFKLRFLGIDTPETHAGEDPWGLAAANYTKEKLEHANTIVLESEGARTETYGRYLGFVWVDGELLNLEIIEQAYSNSTLNKSKYKEIFMEASVNSMKTGRRFFGEIDPAYDYENRRFY